MKTGIHPVMYTVTVTDLPTGKTFETTSTIKANYSVEVSKFSHNSYTKTVVVKEAKGHLQAMQAKMQKMAEMAAKTKRA